MAGHVAVVTDSASYLPGAVRERFGILTIPMTVVLDDEAFQEFVTLDSSTFYRRLMAGARVTTSQPSPKRLIEAYERAAAGGAAEILSVHVASSLSGTTNSARIAALASPIPVTVVDTGQASFIEGNAPPTTVAVTMETGDRSPQRPRSASLRSVTPVQMFSLLS